MASKKIHLLRQSAVEAGTPRDYYINPSEKLMSRISDWSVVEHEDYIETRFNMPAFPTPVAMKRYNNQALGDCENKDDDFSYILNTDYLNIEGAEGGTKDGLTVCTYPKIKAKKNKKNSNSRKNKKKIRNQKKNY